MVPVRYSLDCHDVFASYMNQSLDVPNIFDHTGLACRRAHQSKFPIRPLGTICPESNSISHGPAYIEKIENIR